MRMCARILLLLVLVGACAEAQVLARPGWAGSGVTAEPWWRHAVFYRVHPELFQDSDGNGQGDLKGIAQRMGYLTDLGVDALVLVPPFSEDDFGDLARAASAAHIRVLIQLDSAAPGEARRWLSQGAAGLFLDSAAMRANPTAAQLRDLRKLTQSFPGDRILLTSGLDAVGAEQSAQLSVAQDLMASRPDAASLRRQLSANLNLPAGVNPMLELSGLARPVATAQSEAAILDRALALMLFGSRAAVMFDAGRELGLRSADGQPVAMQWTPANVTAAAPVERVAPPAPKEEVYGTYVPYVPGMRPKTAPAPAKPAEDAAPPPVDPNTLPGFTNGTLPEAAAVNGETANAALEDRSPNSLLNFYRHLIALHHGNPTIRNGAETVLERDAQGTLIWLRREPSGARTAASVVIACNLSEQPAELDLTADLAQEQLRATGPLRPLLTASATPLMTAAENALPVETAGHFILPAFTLFVGELDHEGLIQQGTGRGAVRHRRRR